MVGKQRISKEQKDKILEGHKLGYNSYKTAEYARVSHTCVLKQWNKLSLKSPFYRGRKLYNFYSSMTDEGFIQYVKENHYGRAISELEGTIYQQARKRDLIDKLVKDGILIRKIKPFIFYSRMADEQFIQYIKDKHQGDCIAEFLRDKGAYDSAQKRGFLERLIEEKIIFRRRKTSGFYSNMTNEELIQFTKENCQGQSLSNISKVGSGLYQQINRRKLIDKLVKENILVRRKLYNFYSSMTDEELAQFIKKDHKGKRIIELQKFSQLYKIVRKRNLLDKLIEGGVLIRERKSKNFYSSMTDEGFIQYVKENHYGRAISELEGTIYQQARKRDLIDKLVKDGILIRSRSKRGQFLNFSDNEFIQYTKDKYYGKTLFDLQKADIRVYDLARKRGLIDKLVEDGILIRERIRITKKAKETLETIADWPDEEKIIILGALPSHKKYSGDDLRRAIKRDERYPKATLGPLKVNYDTNRQYDVQQQVYDLLIMDPKVINDKKALDLLVNKIFSVHQGKVSNNPDTIDGVIEGIRKILEDVR